MLVLLVAVVTGAWADGIVCTASDLGKVLCTDGSIYEKVSAAEAAGKTAAAVIVYVDETNKKGLAIALADEGSMNWSTAKNTCEGKTAITGAKWCLPSQNQWEQMFQANGGNTTSSDGLITTITTAGGTALQGDATYWSSSENSPGVSACTVVLIYDIVGWGNGSEDNAGYRVRACLAFAPPSYAVKMADAETEAENANWTIASGSKSVKGSVADGLTGLEEGDAVTVTYSGRMKVKSVTATTDAVPPYAANEYKEASWDGSKVVFTKKTAASEPTAVADANTNVTWGDGWYTVSGNVTITGNVTLTADAHLILQDGATLTINGQLNCRTNGKNLYIYGQKKGDGKLNVTNNGANAINSNTGYRIYIHGGEVTASAAGGSGTGLFTGYLAVYGGKLTATSGGGNGIGFGNTIDVYGGEVVATSNATSDAHYGFRSSGSTDNQNLTVYGGKVTATGNGKFGMADYGSGFSCYVKSGTSGIKFYFSADDTTWGDGTSYASATKVGNDDATKKRYAKAE